MAKEVSPTKVTGGGGFEFEDKVAAFFMCCLLSERPPLDPSFGVIKRISFQVRADGWLLDDLLLTLRKNDQERQCAFSIKSNVQFSKTSAPSDFVRAAWEQYLGEVTSPFKRAGDRLGLITSPHDIDTKTKLENLLMKARVQESNELFSRIKEEGYISKEGRSIFKSFSCPQDLSEKHSVNETNIGELLRHIEHLEFDFEHTSSAKLSEAISILKSILESGSLDEAMNLWESLCSIGKDRNAHGGYVDIEVLISELRQRYRLKDFPDHAAIWERLRRSSREELDLIRDKIADSVAIDRSGIISDISNKLVQNNTLILLGDSGSGKTVIEKSIAESKLTSSKVIWVNAENLSLFDDIPSWEIFKVIPDQTAFLIIDALDRFYEESAFKKVALLLKACSQNIEKSPWKIIISCQPEEWLRVQITLSKLNISANWEIINIANPSDDALKAVWERFPILRSLSLHLHLRQFVCKPKVLDLIARRLSSGGTVDPRGWVGESGLISWYWEEEIEAKPNGLRQGVILKNLAEHLADNLSIELPETEFSVNELSVVQELIRCRILKRRNDRISFEHDLVADWTRQRILLEKYPNISEYLRDRLTSPMWCKALRLLGVDLLEKGTDIQRWKNIVDSFAGEADRGNLGQDLLLEASIFSANPVSNLEKQWSELKNNDGVLLRRLLNRFLYSASYPSALALLIAKQYEDEPTAELVTTYRDPYWLYWIPVIKFLHNHKSDATKLAQKHVAEIVDKWLRFSKKDWPAREEAAEIAIDIAEDILALKMSRIMLYDRSGLVNLAFRSGLAACNEQPDRSMDFALTACSRKKPTGRILDLIVKYNEEVSSREKKVERPKSKIPPALLSPFHESEPPPPWPDGPREQVERDFHEICLESDTQSDALYPLISSFPEKAREIILALLIEHPTPRDRYSSRFEQYTGLTYVHRWFPPFYTRGPFYFFLNAHPEKGLDLILTLINFATERWAEQWKEKGAEAPYVEIEFTWGKKRLIGDANVYYWHRDAGGNISHIIPSALMAIEKWLYDRMDNEENEEEVVKYIARIMKEGTSLSFIGLLISIGKKYQALFSDHLLSLLAVPEFFSWDMEHIIKSEGHQMIGWFDLGKGMMGLARKFHSMPHRKVQLDQVAIKLFLSNEDVRNNFEEYRARWKDRFSRSEFETVSPDTLENLIQWFDISNWKTRTDPENRKISIEFEMPKEMAERRQQGFKELQDRQLLIHLPIKFRRILNGEEQLAPDEAEKVWNTVRRVSEIVMPEDHPDYDILSKENAICGGIAVLYKNYKGWLREDPDKEQWCINKITGLIQGPPPDRSFDSEVGIGNWLWDRFCAEVMPIIWADDPENPLYRRCIAILTINKHYETVGILFTSASKLRNVLKNHFRQLINFLLNWSHARWKYYREQHAEKKSFDVTKWLEKEVNAFEKVTYPTEAQTWELIAQEEIKRRNKLYEKQSKRRGGQWKPPKEAYFDLWLLKAAFSWMPSLDQAVDTHERSEWLRFWKQALAWTVNKFEIDEDGEISGTPSEWDRWLFELIAIQVLHMTDDEKPEVLWRPILDLGAEGHYWVDDFLTEWFMKGIVSNGTGSFTKRWIEMIEYAFISEKWSSPKGRRWYYRTKLWCELLGMNYIISELWDESKKPIIREMKGYFERWARTSLTNPESAVMFIYFLMRPAVEVILTDGFIWLEKAAVEAGDNFFTDRHDNVQKPLASLLEISWKKHKTLIQSKSEVYNAFKNLLRKLVDLQVPQAIEIQQNLV